MLAEYDAEIKYCDRHVGRLLDTLRAQDRYADALVVLVADHGEEFGEHGLYSEHWSTHEGTQRIPLVVKPPGGADREANDALVTNVDVAPTVLEYAGLDQPDGWHGRSLRPLVAGADPGWREHVGVALLQSDTYRRIFYHTLVYMSHRYSAGRATRPGSSRHGRQGVRYRV